MSVWSCFLLTTIALISWSPATLAKMVGNVTRKSNYATIYVVVLAVMAFACLACTPARNLSAPHGWGLVLIGLPVTVAGALLASWLDNRILRHITNARTSGPSTKRSASPGYLSGDVSAQQPVWVTRARVARSVQNMPLWQLLVIAVGEEVGFRVGVPVISLRATPAWLALTAVGALLFACCHSVFGRGQVLSKIPLAALGTILFIFWGIWACVLGHLIYNSQYWWNRNGYRRVSSVADR